MTKYIYLLLGGFFCLTACQSNEATNGSEESVETTNKDCKYSAPIAVFSDTIEQIKMHEFTRKGQEATEKVVFENGVELELIQSGCNNVYQAYNFYLSIEDNSSEVAYWLDFSIGQFRYMAGLDETYFQLNGWANALANVGNQLRLGKKVQVEPGFYVTLDKIWTGEKTLIQVILESDN